MARLCELLSSQAMKRRKADTNSPVEMIRREALGELD